jgi:NNP family nitrate/nitrite transporter-like MFS transporter
MSNLEKWDVEDQTFWESTGKSVATRNLWISIPSLLCGFAVWGMWGIIAVKMENLGFTFTKSQLLTLTAIAGLSGGTLRIPSSFLIRLAGGRNTIFFTTALLMIPSVGAGIALQNPNTPLWVFQILALTCGFGGGNFASSMSNISFFYPKKNQGYALGMNAGLGNFGVTTMQILIPFCMAMVGAAFAGWVWMFLLIPLAFLGWFKMNNICTEAVSPNIKGPLVSFGRISRLLGIGFITASLGLYLILTFEEQTWVKYLVLPAVIASTVFLMKALSPGEVKASLTRQYKIFDAKHTWIMTIIYTMTFGSFIGFAAAVPLAIKYIFGVQHVQDAAGVWQHDLLNPDGPDIVMYVWVGAFVGALIRPVGGWLADKTGGAILTQGVAVIMTVCTIGVGYYAQLAYKSATPQEYFIPFFVLIVILFAATGIGNGSTFRTISMIFNEEQRGPVLGWTSAVAAYGAFLIPKVIGEQVKAGTPEIAMYGFAVFYAICAVLNWWYYLGPKAEYKNP